MNVRPDLQGRQAEPAVQREGAPGAELRRQQGRDHPDHDPGPRQAHALLHVLDDAALRRAGPLPVRSRQGQGAAGRGRLRRTASRCRSARCRAMPTTHNDLAGRAADVGAGRRQAAASSQVDNATRTARYREGDFQMRTPPGPTTSPTRARSRPTSSTSRTSSRCIPAGRTSAVDELFEKSQQEIDPKARRAVQGDPGELQRARRRSCISTRRPIRWRSARRSRASCRSRSATTSSRRPTSRSRTSSSAGRAAPPVAVRSRSSRSCSRLADEDRRRAFVPDCRCTADSTDRP